MVASELRIGNVINTNYCMGIIENISGENNTVQVKDINGDKSAFDMLSRCTGVKLTSDILSKMGLVKQRVKDYNDESGVWWCGPNMKLRFLFEYDERPGIYTYGPMGITVSTVHKIQNLYFEITAEEIVVNRYVFK